MVGPVVLGGVLTPSLASYVTLGTLVNFSELLFPLLLNAHITGSLRRFSDLTHMTYSAQCLKLMVAPFYYYCCYCYSHVQGAVGNTEEVADWGFRESSIEEGTLELGLEG